MVHVLETGLEFIAQENPGGKPAVRGYNIINGQLTSASDGSTFKSTNPAFWLIAWANSHYRQGMMLEMHFMLLGRLFLLGLQHQPQLEDRSSATWADF